MRLLKLFVLLSFIILSACGYKAMNNVYDLKFEIINFDLNGDKKINQYLERNFLRFSENKNSDRSFEIKTNSKYIKTVTSKDTTGKETGFSIKVIIKLDVLENNQILASNIFEKNISYNNLNSQFELKQYENVLIKDLTDQIILNINNYIGSIQ